MRLEIDSVSTYVYAHPYHSFLHHIFRQYDKFILFRDSFYFNATDEDSLYLRQSFQYINLFVAQ